MGEKALQFYHTKLTKEYKIAFIFTFFIALLIHLYKFANTLPNHDSLWNYYSDQNILTSGRWALSLACGISSYWDLPWVIGLLSCVFIALTAVLVVALFKLKNPILIGLTGALLAAAPAMTQTLFYLYTADGYMISMFLAALAVYLSRMEETRKSRLLLSGICICVSCGIYQAYVSFALLLAVCYLIDVLLQDTHSKQECLQWILRQVIIYAVSLAGYYVIWKLCMHFSGAVATDYQGISAVGTLSVRTLIHALPRSIVSIILYFLQTNVLEHGFSLYSILNILFLLAMAAGLLLSFLKSKVWKRKWAVLLLVLCLIAIIPLACIWNFTSETVKYEARMLQCLTLLFVLTAVLYERWAKPVAKNVVALLLVVIVFNNALMANISYFYLNLCYERSYAEGVEMMVKIHDLQEEYEFNKIAIIGNRYKSNDDAALESPDLATAKNQNPMLNNLIYKSLLYDSDHTALFLLVTFGMELNIMDSAQRDYLSNRDEVRSMGCWPDANSIAVVDDIVVIKFSD